MTSKEFEKMFLDLNSVLVKFWKEQGRPDKEIKIELLERMLNWYKKMGYCTLDAQSANGSSEIPNDLEEAAGDYAEKHGFRVPYDGSDNFYDDVDVKASKEGFIAGAEWQAEHAPLHEDTVLFNKGVEEGKRLMMEEAVEGEVFIAYADYKEAIISFVVENTKLDYLETGDKVRVIVCKKED